MSSRYDVVVIGAGVAGLTAAWNLGKKGYKVALIEKKPRSKIGDKTCGDAIGLHHFNELGWSLPNDVVDGGYSGVKIVSPSKKYSIIVEGEGISVDSLKFGQWLLRNAIESGVDVYDSTFLTKAHLDSNGFVEKIIVRNLVTREYTEIYGKVFIDASGAVPALRTKLPREWPIAERPRITDYNMAYREVIELEEPITGEDKDYATIYLDQEVAPGGYWWFFPKRDGRIGNIGVGVIWSTQNYNPRHQYNKYIKPLFRGKLVHAGGGLVPTRRPLPTLVWRNVIVVGDAAYTVNPVHGGGRGSSMLAATIASKHIAEALDRGRVDEYTLWGINMDYMKAYGAKQAGLDVVRMYLQKMDNSDLEFILKKKIVDGRSVYDLGTKASLTDEILNNVKKALSLLTRPSLLNQLRIVKMYMDKAKEYYLEKYPETPDKLSQWRRDVEELFRKYTKTIGYEPGPYVNW